MKAIKDINETLFSEDAGGRPEAEKTVVLFMTQQNHGDHSLADETAHLHKDPK